MATYNRLNLYMDALKVQAQRIAQFKVIAEKSDNVSTIQDAEKVLQEADYNVTEIITMADVYGYCPTILREYLDEVVGYETENYLNLRRIRGY